MLGGDHPDVGSSHTRVGTVCMELGEHVEAHRHLDKALAIARKAAGGGSVEVANVQFLLARVERLEGRAEQAKELFGAAAAIFARELGPEDPHTQAALQESR
mmetsp:Transcript_67454/g.166626  ORF Transcript_67454/g.166626 Transcript_67454/m.166626 type:complete len:102 (+) Transcript_67454:2-307(+)